ncbi:hypothetical protein ZTR_10596 [Talaromyces verruculosus]|nr:hypothetical protein ZTR_10596 [Talaromyces verruculosus]
MARAWYYDSDDSVKDNSSTESISSDTDLTEPEDGYSSETDQTDSGAEDSDVDLSETQDETFLDADPMENDDGNINDAEESGTLSHQSLTIKELAISINQRYEDPADNPTQNLSDIDPDFNKSPNTRKLRSRVIDRWHRFCKVKVREKCHRLNWRKPEAALRRASADWLYRFLHWCCRLRHGKDNRVCKGYGSADSLKTDWKYLRVYYQATKKRKMKKSMAARLRTGIAQLIVEFKLRTQPRKNDPVYIEDMIPFNETILRTQEKRFYLGIQRIMLCLVLMLGLFTAGRKTAILKLQYKHLRLSLQRNPHGGPPVLSIDIEPEYIKTLLGIKALNTFSFPEIIYGVSLVFSPHVFIMGLLFHARAFQANIRSMDDMRRLFVMRGCQQLELPLKKEMDDYYLFCKVEEVDGEPRIIRDQPMSDGVYYAAIKAISFIMGLLCVFLSVSSFMLSNMKCLGWVSESGRNLIMYHADTSTFVKHYCPRNHTQMQQVVFGMEEDVLWDHALNGMNRNKDKRRPRFLDDTEKAFVESEPELQEAIPVPTVWTLEGEWQRRSEGVDAIIPYCDFREGGPLRGRRKQKRSINDDYAPGKAIKASTEEENNKFSSTKTKHEQEQEHIRTAKKPLICFQCGKKFTQHQSLLRHFRPKHLNDQMCNFCADGMEYLERMHWRNHAAAVHRLKT